MVEQPTNIEIGQFQTLSSLIASNEALQSAIIVLVVGFIAIFSVYFKFANWIQKQKFSYVRPQFSRFVQKAVLPVFALALISSTNAYIQIFELFDDEQAFVTTSDMLTPKETFAKLLNTVNFLVIGYTVSQLIPIMLTKREKSNQERIDFEKWIEKRGFQDDPCRKCDFCAGKKYGICKNQPDLLHEIFEWIPPSRTPDDFTEEEFRNYLKTQEGRKYLENYRTSTGQTIGSYKAKVKDPFEVWKESERKKHLRYLNFCLTGNNASGMKLRLGKKFKEIYSIDEWREIKREESYDYVIPGGKLSGYYEQKQKSMPKSVRNVIPIGIVVVTVVSIASWWGVDLVILATATGGLGVGIGLALKETMENYFAYLVIRKDKIVEEGERIQLESGYNGYVYRITPRVT